MHHETHSKLLGVDFVDFNLACGINPFPSSEIIVAAMEKKFIVQLLSVASVKSCEIGPQVTLERVIGLFHV